MTRPKDPVPKVFILSKSSRQAVFCKKIMINLLHTPLSFLSDLASSTCYVEAYCADFIQPKNLKTAVQFRLVLIDKLKF